MDGLLATHLLDPTNDIVFKLLLLRDQSLLRDMIEAVLGLCVPIRELQVLNPEIPKDFPGDKSVVLDIRARFDDGRQIDLEMQSTIPAGTSARFLYYWARNFFEGLASLNCRSCAWRRLNGRLNSSGGPAFCRLKPSRNSKS